MKAKSITKIILTVFLASMLTLPLNLQTVKAEPTTIIVPDDYPTIRQAVNVANTGDTIYVRAGIYYENVILHSWDSGLRLVGENRDTTIINGGGRLWVMWVGADYTTVSGFTLRNGGYGYGGIRLDNSHNSLVNNTFISNNWVGIEILRSNDNTIQGNVIDSNTWWGILIDYDSSYNTIKSNDISYNHYGIGFSTHPSFPPGIIDNVIYHNNFVNNAEQVWINPWGGQIVTNIWDDGYPSGGNYWSDQYHGDCADHFTGPNQDIPGSDGIVDTPYHIDVDNQDNYPLVKPFGGLHDIGITGITTSETIVEQGYMLDINITVLNYGFYTETFNLTAYAKTTVISQTEVTLTSRNSATITFIWDTAGVALGNYIISAHATPVPNEIDRDDNYFEDGVVTIATPEYLAQKVIETIETWNLQKGTENSLSKKLEDILGLLEMGNENGAIHKLMDFINQVEALRGKKLNEEQADYLIEEAQRIIDFINE